jgi:predicted nuclease with RNAse H fold
LRTLGIDLASKPKKTAVCEIEWSPGTATVTAVQVGVDDHVIFQRAGSVDVIGIDSPFGWPRPFVEFINRSVPQGTEWTADLQRSLSYRLTDIRVWNETKLVPLSVAADKIALPAMRCVGLLGQLGVSDRSGDGRVFEVYPAAALRAWGFEKVGPKGIPENLGLLNDAVCSRCPWLSFSNGAEQMCRANDDAFDALIASISAHAAALGLTLRPTLEEAERARTEGWIALPRCDSLELLLS